MLVIWVMKDNDKMCSCSNIYEDPWLAFCAKFCMLVGWVMKGNDEMNSCSNIYEEPWMTFWEYFP